MTESSAAKKLRILPGCNVLAVNVPDDASAVFSDLPEGVSVSSDKVGTFDVVVAFYTEKEALNSQIESVKRAAGDNGILWICYPKGSSKVETDLNRDIIRLNLEEKHGLKAVSLVAVDEIWSAMRLKRA